jgi:hypothetical protein
MWREDRSSFLEGVGSPVTVLIGTRGKADTRSYHRTPLALSRGRHLMTKFHLPHSNAVHGCQRLLILFPNGDVCVLVGACRDMILEL